METLQQYRIQAIKILRKARTRKGKLPLTDELITNVVTALAQADYSFDPGKGLTKYAWKRYKAICAIKDYVRQYKRHKQMKQYGYSRSVVFKDRRDHIYNDKADQKVEFLMRNAGLTSAQRRFIEAYLQHNGIANACEQSGITYKEGAGLWNAAIKKFKRVAAYAT